MATCAKRVSIRLIWSLVIVDELTDNSWELLDKNLSQGHVQYKGPRARNRKSD